MNWRKRIYSFPGGILETNSDDGDSGGVYLESFRSADPAVDGSRLGVIRWRPTCLGYLRTDVSRSAMRWDQSEVRRVAEQLGYDFADFVIYDPKFGRPPLARLKAQATRLEAEAVIVPSALHFDGGRIPMVLAARIDVITVNSEL
ncbi:hypothetical protein JK358_32520 [Nocardia sp. 2]|uniref:Uncharacterized protein n=1 Tax=Nocardia acididurans TaxID=2802282 RepID=A0ABS1MEY9_9NOCA|nr:hypothetical protein [Nocardia acididurans]MBL1079139.1 hypothetical protein [Nocardia acididurans]